MRGDVPAGLGDLAGLVEETAVGAGEGQRLVGVDLAALQALAPRCGPHHVVAAILVDGHAPFWPKRRAAVASPAVDQSDDRTVPLKTLLRWSEALAGIARTGLGFTESLYEQERFEEILKVAADIRVEADGQSDEPDYAGGLVQEWMDTVGKGVPGYITPKVAVGAAVGNEAGELLLIQRADSGIWLYPTGWCDIGYSAAEVVVKEVEEETGIIAEPVRLIAVLDGLRLGHDPDSALFAPLLLPGRRRRAQPASARDARRRVVHPRHAALPAGGLGALGRPCLRRPQRRGARGALRPRPPAACGGATRTRRNDRHRDRHQRRRRAVRLGGAADPAAVALGAGSRSRGARTHGDRHATTLFVARSEGAIVGMLTLASFQVPTGVRSWIEDVVVDEAARGQGAAVALVQAALDESARLGSRTVDLTSRPHREAANRLYLRMGFEVRQTNVYRWTAEGSDGS